MDDGQQPGTPVGGGDITTFAGPQGAQVNDLRPRDLYGRLVSSAAGTGDVAGRTAYTWVPVNEADAAGDFPDDASDFATPSAGLPAVEVNDTPVPLNTKVRLRLSPTQTYYVFERAGTPWVPARVVSGSDAAGYVCYGIRETAPNTWADLPGPVVYAECYRAPSNRAPPDIDANQTVLLRPSPTLAGKYEITPWGAQKRVTFTYTDGNCAKMTGQFDGRDLVFTSSPVSPPPPPPPPPPVTITVTVIGRPQPHGPYAVGTTVGFTATGAAGGVGAPASWTYTWDPGDGTGGASGVGLTEWAHAYAAAGSYFPTLSVTDGSGGTSGAVLCGNGDGSGRYDVVTDPGPTKQPVTQIVLADFSSTSITLADVTDGTTYSLSAPVGAGRVRFEAVLFCDLDATGGAKVTVLFTTAPNWVIFNARMQDDAAKTFTFDVRVTTNGGATAHGNSPTAATIYVNGTADVATAGTLKIQFAQETASGTSKVLKGSYLNVMPPTGG